LKSTEGIGIKRWAGRGYDHSNSASSKNDAYPTYSTKSIDALNLSIHGLGSQASGPGLLGVSVFSLINFRSALLSKFRVIKFIMFN